MTFDDIKPISSSGGYGYAYDPNKYYSNSAQTRANYGVKGGAEEGVSNVFSGVGGALSSVFPAVGGFMALGKTAYSGLKSTNSGVGDYFADWFAPHHTVFGYFDDAKGSKDYSKNIGLGFASLLGGGLVSSILSVARGKEKRKQAKLNELKLQNQGRASDYSPTGVDLSAVAQAGGAIGGALGSMGIGKLTDKGGALSNDAVDSQTVPTEQVPTGADGQQEIEVGQSDYWNSLWGESSGGGVTGLQREQSNYETAPQVDNTTLNPYATMRKGGKIDGASHEEGDGGIALVDTETGEDTGVRVEGGETVVNKEDWATILGLLDNGNAKKAKSLMKKIEKREPKKEYEGGGVLNLPSSGNWDSFGTLTEEYPYQNAPDIQQTSVVETPSVTEAQTITETPKGETAGFDWMNALGYGFDALKLGLGTAAASQKLPKWNIPNGWQQYVDKAKYYSEMGITPEERAAFNDRMSMDYAANVRDLTNASGGNAGALLGSLVAANRGRYRATADLAVKDRMLKQQNFDRFGDVLLQDIGLKKQKFDIENANAVRDKTAGAQLMNDALYNLDNRMQIDKDYGKNSTYGKYMQALRDKGASDAEIAKAQQEWWSKPENITNLYTAIYGGKPTVLVKGATTPTSTNFFGEFDPDYKFYVAPY